MDHAGIPCTIDTLMDVTDINRYRRELEESERRYRKLFEKANDALFMEREDDAIVDVNAKARWIVNHRDRRQRRVPVWFWGGRFPACRPKSLWKNENQAERQGAGRWEKRSNLRVL